MSTLTLSPLGESWLILWDATFRADDAPLVFARDAENIGVGFAQMDEARRDEEIDELAELEFSDAVFVELAAFVVDDGYTEPVLCF